MKEKKESKKQIQVKLNIQTYYFSKYSINLLNKISINQ